MHHLSLSLSLSLKLDSYKDYLLFAAKSNYKTVSDYFKSIGVPQLDPYFNEFKFKFNRKYNSEEEEERKYNFLKTIQYIESHNKLYESGDVSHIVGVNHFADWTPEEYESIKVNNYLGSSSISISISINISITSQNNDILPYSDDNTFDWLTLKKVTPVKDQNKCDSCWAFATVATIESAYLIKKNNMVILSEQNLLDFSYPDNNCKDGGYAFKAFEYARDHGLERESNYSYTAVKDVCRANFANYRFRISRFQALVNVSDQIIKNAIKNNGPVVASFNADGADFESYKKGIITGGPTNPNHSVTIVGWGPDYWIVKNSFNTDWGEKGYARIATGNNVRGINSELYYPIL